MDKSQYNKFVDFPLFPYNCVSHLINSDSAELLWKLLYYDDNNAWKNDTAHPNLTRSQKGAMIFAGQTEQNDYSVFLDYGMDTAWVKQGTQIRISSAVLVPTNHIVGNLMMSFEVYSHFAVNTLSNYTTRADTITQLFLSEFNGEEIDGIGRLYFDARASNKCNSVEFGEVPFKGKRTVMCNWIT